MSAGRGGHLGPPPQLCDAFDDCLRADTAVAANQPIAETILGQLSWTFVFGATAGRNPNTDPAQPYAAQPPMA